MVLGRPSRRSLITFAAGVGLGALAGPGRSIAAPLADDQRERLDRGEVVAVPLDVDLEAGSYFGGVAYVRIEASVAEVAAVINDPRTYGSILPRVLETRLLERRGNELRLFFRQGGKLGSAAYVLLARRESEGLLRFWLDPAEPHDVRDLWGFLRVEPYGEGSLLTYAALLRLDAGLVKLLFSETIRRIALGTPGVVRAYVESHRASSR